MGFPRPARAAAAGLLALGMSVLGGVSPAQAASHDYVALGDSYSSGVGADDYYSDSGDCRRSANAYPVLWADANAPSSFHFTACSGAETDDVVAGQLGPLNASTDVVSVSVGGNDAGFSDVMMTCVTQGEEACVRRVEEAKQYIADVLPGRLDTAYRAIRSKAPYARVVVMGYPRMYMLNGYCWGGLSETSRAAINSAADDLAAVTADRAGHHGFAFGDVRRTFAGHELCSGDAWLYSVRWDDVVESYHPRVEGQSGGYYPVLESLA